ncbi:hypothetical protein PHYC_03354 [Phycisphaerales bacterium]|nr:hypothetical protein PHYC_03354 [Phycisphaerales bacterium]
MHPTKREAEAAERLTGAIVEFVQAVIEGVAERRPKPPPAPRQEPAKQMPAMQVPTGLLDQRQAAAFLGISPGTLFNMSAPRGPMPVVKLNSRVLYDPADLRAAVERAKVRPSRSA